MASFAIVLVTGLMVPDQWKNIEWSLAYTIIPAATFAVFSARWLDESHLGFRALRITSVESALFIGSFFISTFRAMTIITVYFPFMIGAGDWIMTVGALAGQNGAILGAAIFAGVTLVRTIFGKEPGVIEVEAV